MTPFGLRLREMRAAKGARLKDMAGALGVSPAYLSALEHGKRGRPSRGLFIDICAYFNIIWDDADALERLAWISHPRVIVDTSELTSDATELANLLAESIGALDQQTVRRMLSELRALTK